MAAVLRRSVLVYVGLVVGRRTNTAPREWLIVMFIREAVFGEPGLVAAPLYCACTKRELHQIGPI